MSRWIPPEDNLLSKFINFIPKASVGRTIGTALYRAYINGFIGCITKKEVFDIEEFDYNSIRGSGENINRAVLFNYTYKLIPDAFKYYQDYGSCTYASLSSKAIPHLLAVQQLLLGDELTLRYPGSVVWYSTRGYCQDGSHLGQAAVDFSTKGVPFRKKYSQIDLSDENYDEYVGARLWCRTGPPQLFLDEVKREGGFFKVSRLTTISWEIIRDILANGGIIHTGSNYTAVNYGDPVSPQVRVIGGHAQVLAGYDNSDEFKNTYKINEPVLIWHQTWGDWNSVTNWPKYWGRKPQGAFVLKYSKALALLDECYVYMPNATNFMPERIIWSTA